jgi:hypothetical protein
VQPLYIRDKVAQTTAERNAIKAAKEAKEAKEAKAEGPCPTQHDIRCTEQVANAN